MSYATQANLETLYGVQSIAEWGNFTPGASMADATRIAMALAVADSIIDTALTNGPYLVPIVGTTIDPPTLIVQIAATLAGHWLWDTRNLHKTKEIQMEMQRKHNEAIGMLSMIQLSRLPIPASFNRARSTAPRLGACRR